MSATEFSWENCSLVPGQTAVIEASAGTGKTYTIAGMTALAVGHGTPIDRIAVVTFTRAATNELRERVRGRLVAVSEQLTLDLASRTDPVARVLDGVPQARARLEAALVDFDAATIDTIHGFAAGLRRRLGHLAELPPKPSTTQPGRRWASLITHDVYLAHYGRADSPVAPFTPRLADDLGRAVIEDSLSDIGNFTGDPEAAQRLQYAHDVRATMQARLEQHDVVSYDQLLAAVAQAIADPADEQPPSDRLQRARERVSDGFEVVLVDEFQDTDPTQWDILRHGYLGRCAVVLIGDPKQAIYNFRGGDLDTYLSATSRAELRWRLGTNHRSDQALVDGVTQLFAGVQLGSADVRITPVRAARQSSRLSGPGKGSTSPAVQLRVMPEPGKRRPSATATTEIAADLAAELTSALTADLSLETANGTRPLGLDDVAVLVNTHREAAMVRDALHDRGVPVLLSGAAAVWLSDAARDWWVLLQAILHPTRPGFLRDAAVTGLIGWSVSELAAAAEVELDELAARLRRMRRTLERRGTLAVLLGELAPWGLYAGSVRTARHQATDRYLSDARQLAEILDQARRQEQLNPAALVQWLARRLEHPELYTAQSELSRLEAPSGAVRVMTVHAAKGLEFPIVYLPYLWTRHQVAAPAVVLGRAAGRRTLDVSGPRSPGHRERLASARAREAEESLRLAYVALTRASSRCVLWWSHTKETPQGPLHRLLFGDPDADGGLRAPLPVPKPDVMEAKLLHRFAAGASGLWDVVHVRNTTSSGPGLATDSPWLRELARRPPEAQVRRLPAAISTTWTRTSYSSLTAAAHDVADPATHLPVSGTDHDTDRSGLDEPPTSTEPAPESSGSPAGVLLPMRDLPTGARFGTYVHEVLEEVIGQGATAADLTDHLTRAAAQAPRVVGVPAAELAAALAPALQTDLGALFGHRSLVDLQPTQVKAEMGYEFGLPSRDGLRIADLADLIRQHLPDGDPLADYPARLAGAPFAEKTLRGFLSGFIDAIIRVPDSAGEDRFIVVDYKTNWLSAPDRLDPGDYSPSRLAEAMQTAHYPLQALLYAVAVYRYLRWRLPHRPFEQCWGGVGYLFLRGMTPQTGDALGVFAWQPPASLVIALSDLLHDGLAATESASARSSAAAAQPSGQPSDPTWGSR